MTDMRTGAVDRHAGAKHLAAGVSRVLGPYSARAAPLLKRAPCRTPFGFDENTRALAPPGKPHPDASRCGCGRDSERLWRAKEDWPHLVEGADIVVEAARLSAPEPMLEDRVDQEGRTGRPLWNNERESEHSLTDIMDKMVVDDWGQGKSGVRVAARACRVRQDIRGDAHAEIGRDRRRTQDRPRARWTEDPCFWHRGSPYPTSRSGTRCWRRRRVSDRPASALKHDARANARMYAGGAGRERPACRSCSRGSPENIRRDD